MLRGRALTRRVAIDDVGEHNRRMWERLAEAGIPYTRPQGKPPRDARGKRRFLDDLTRRRLRGVDLDGKRVLSLAGSAAGAVLLAKIGATTPVRHQSATKTVRALARTGTQLVSQATCAIFRVRVRRFDIVSHHHSMC